MSGVRYDGNITTAARNVPIGSQAAVFTLPYGTVEVFTDATLTATVPLFFDEALTQAIANPLQTDAEGRFGFWVSPGTYLYQAYNAFGAVVGTYPLSLNSPAGPQGPNGSAGGNIMAIGLQSTAGGMVIPAGTNAVQTTGQSVVGKGIAVYSYASTLDASYVASHPQTSFADSTGKVYILSEPVVNVQHYGAVGDGVTDDTAAIQAAFNDISNGFVTGMYFPRGYYNISAAITVAADVLTGICIYGESRNGTTINQLTNNTPIFHFTNVSLHHTWDWSDIHFNWQNLQTGTGNSNSTALLWSGDAGTARSVYNCTFSRIFCTNGYWFMKTDSTALFWGSSTRDVFCGTQGGFVDLDGNAGNPHVLWDQIYIGGGAAGVNLFQVNAMSARYNVEVNGSSAGLIQDISGGSHQIEFFGLETAHFTQNTVLFDVRNGSLDCDGVLYTSTITIDAGISVTVFQGGGGDFAGSGSSIGTGNALGGRPHIFVKEYQFTIVSMGASSALVIANYSSNNGRKCIFGNLYGPWTAFANSTAVQLTDTGSSDSASQVEVGRWNDPGRNQVITANTPIYFDGPRQNIIANPLAAILQITLPAPGVNYGQNLFSGRIYEFLKYPGAGTTYDIQILNSDGSTFATIPAATVSAVLRVRWDRQLAGTGGGYFTRLPVDI